MGTKLIGKELKCFHCGDECISDTIQLDEKTFCCEGCKTVYNLLSDNGLCTYYDLENHPGMKVKASQKEQYAYLENTEIESKLLDFNESDLAKVNLYLPSIHCSSCIWLLENLSKIENGVLSSRVHFLEKKISVSFRKSQISLRRIVEILDSFGYPPEITLEQYTKKEKRPADYSLIYKIGIAGFCASNIMLLSFPDYFGLEKSTYSLLVPLFGYLNLLLAIPVLFYSASDYFTSAYIGLRNKMLNLDVPIALGMAAIFLRSAYEIVFHVGSGYLDSLTGLVFFLLIGKWYQQKTYNSFSFERDYQSYFPVAITRIMGKEECAVPVHDLEEGDCILVKNNELIPADTVLEEGEGRIDYSFVTGESSLVAKAVGDMVFAGGKQQGGAIRLTVRKKMSQSYLLQLWDQEVFRKQSDSYFSSFVLTFSRYFVYGTLLIALFTSLYWYLVDPSKVLFTVTSVLLVACPCALALALPFALGNALRWLGKEGLYLKNADMVEKLSEIDTIVFDKTGTLTEVEANDVEYVGEELISIEQDWIKSAARQSNHPLSQSIYQYFRGSVLTANYFSEIPSNGLFCKMGSNEVKMGSASFLGVEQKDKWSETRVYVSINGKVKGYFCVRNKYREGIWSLLQELKNGFGLHLLSGDNENERSKLSGYFPASNMAFEQKPTHKLSYVQYLTSSGKKVMMLGDGLNDAGALKAADVGISVTENTGLFSPSCDGILEGRNLKHLLLFIRYTRQAKAVIKASLVLSVFYNLVGLFFAVRGQLSPLIAAILMPVSSVTVVLFVVIATNAFALHLKKKMS